MIEKLGRLGGWAGMACAVHCMAMPLLVTLLPVLGLRFLQTGWCEVALLSSATLLSTISLCWGFRQHRQIHAMWFLLAGVLWFVIGHLYGHSVWYSLVGGMCFLVASIVNHRLCKSCGHCCEK